MSLCSEPAFNWLEECEVWSACINCGRLAWDHEQADPVADIKDFIAGRTNPPNMRTIDT